MTTSGYRDSFATENALNYGVTQEDINCLVERRLIRREQGAGVERLELIHDCLAEVITKCRDRRRNQERAALALPLVLPIPYEGDEPYLFLSFSLQDGAALLDIDKIHELGFRVCYDPEIYSGEEWKRKIATLIDGCSLFVVFVSQQSMDRIWVRDAVSWACQRKTRILPVFLQPPESIRTDSKDFKHLQKRKCLNRYRFGDAMADYYAALTEDFPQEARQCAEDRDCQILGMGELPEIWDIVNGKLFLSEIEKQQKHQHVVHEILDTLRKTGSVSYTIETIFQLTAEETGAEANLCALPLREPTERRPTNLLTHPLNIGTAYLAPLRLVTGLITRLAENWPPLVTSYGRLVGPEQRNRLEELHYFIEFCWLAWGPSVLTTSLAEDSAASFMVVQAAFGDEANSLPLIMKKEKWRRILAQIRELHDEKALKERFEHRREMGWPVRIENLLIVKPAVDPFFQKLCQHELLQNMFSQKGMDDPEKVALYLPLGDEECLAGKVSLPAGKQEAFYSTAYLWLMLEQEGDGDGELKPGRVIPFFEHANLATSKGLQFLQHCLARKALYHVLGCEEDPDYRERGYYRFATALFPDQMVEILHQETRRLQPREREIVQRRLKIPPHPGGWRSAAEVVRFADALSAHITDTLKAGGKR